MEQEKDYTSDEEKEQSGSEKEGFFEEKPGGTEEWNPQVLVMVAKNLNMIKENSGIVLGDQADLEDVAFHAKPKENKGFGSGAVSDECVVKDEKKLVDWLAQHYNDYEMAFMVALSVFGKTPYLWVYDMAESLFYKMEGEKQEAIQQKLAIPNNLRLQLVGGWKYQDYVYNHMGRVESEFISFQKPEYADRVLRCVWNEFIFFRETLMDWLTGYVYDRNYSKIIMAVEALAKLASFDFDYFNKYVIKKFFEKKEFKADFAVAQIMSRAYQGGKYIDNIDKLFVYWSKEGNLHFSLTALMMGVSSDWGQEKIRIAVDGYLDSLIKEMKSKPWGGYKIQLPVFYTIGERKAVYFKAIVTALYDKLMLYAERKYRNERRLVGQVFFWLLEIDDMQSNVDVNRKEEHKDMIFVKMCLIKNEVAPKTQELWRYLWNSRFFHKEIKSFLEKYLYQYGGCDQSDIDFLRFFLYSFQDDKSDRDNMEYFLKKISLKNRRPVRAAERINQNYRENR